MEIEEAWKQIVEATRTGAIAKKDAALALGISASQLGRWEDAAEEGHTPNLNRRTKKAIASLLEKEEDARLEGVRLMVERFESASLEARALLEARQALRDQIVRPTRPIPEGRDAPLGDSPNVGGTPGSGDPDRKGGEGVA